MHAALPPQVQLPDEEQPSPEVPHVWQACPATPQATPVGGSVHTPSVQQPIRHDVGVHWHEPFMQACPAAHSAPGPHRHPPEGEQLSASPVVQVTHAFPSVPQLMVEVGVMQEPPTTALQHPVGHDAELHTHWPPTHCWPSWHIVSPPQVHCPAVHPSATNAVHDTQAAPAVPQLPGPGASQFAPAQQPDGQLALVHDVHTPVRQFCDKGHGEHVVPPEPQYVSVLPCSQVPWASWVQHPVGHDVPSHMHAPDTQR